MSKARDVVKMIENEYAGMKEQSFTQRHFIAVASMLKELPDPISKEVNKMNRSKRILDLLKENKIHELKDQFGKKVPKDLVLLPSPKDLEEKDIDVVMGAPWYEANGVLMASSKAIEYLSEDDPLDAGINLNDLNLEISYVADALKRYEEDGFYHA